MGQLNSRMLQGARLDPDVFFEPPSDPNLVPPFGAPAILSLQDPCGTDDDGGWVKVTDPLLDQREGGRYEKDFSPFDQSNFTY